MVTIKLYKVGLNRPLKKYSGDKIEAEGVRRAWIKDLKNKPGQYHIDIQILSPICSIRHNNSSVIKSAVDRENNRNRTNPVRSQRPIA